MITNEKNWYFNLFQWSTLAITKRFLKMSSGSKYCLSYLGWFENDELSIRQTQEYSNGCIGSSVLFIIIFSQGERFAKIGDLVGATMFLAFLKFPMVRAQPGFRRVGLSGVLAYPFYTYMHGLATKIKVKRSTVFYHFSQIRIPQTTGSAQR